MYGKPFKCECFSHTNPSNTPRLLQSLLLRCTPENLQVTQLSYGTHAKNFFASLGIFMAQRCRRGADVTKSLGEVKEVLKTHHIFNHY